MNEFEFRPQAMEYDGHNALALGRAAQLAYAGETEVRARLRSWGFRETHFLDREGTQGFIASKEQMILVAFRGTEVMQLEDLKTDASIKLVPGPEGEIHWGFQKGLSYVWEDLKTKLEQLRNQEQPVWFTGHSLGAGLATLAVAELVFGEKIAPNIPVQGLYTFGSPRVGEVTFARAFDAACKRHTFRFRNNNDVVTRVPPPGLFVFRYRHVGNLRYFDANGRLRPDITWQQQFIDRLRGRLDDLGRPGSDGLRDHSIDRYLELLQENVDTVMTGT